MFLIYLIIINQIYIASRLAKGTLRSTQQIKITDKKFRDTVYKEYKNHIISKYYKKWRCQLFQSTEFH